MDEISFDDLTPREVPVTRGGRRYVLREADAAAGYRYRNAVLKAQQFDADGKPVAFDGLPDAEAVLVAGCLFEVGADGAAKAVGVATVRSWPHRDVQVLFRRAKVLSELDEYESAPALEKHIAYAQDRLVRLRAAGMEGPAKNGPPATATGSPSPRPSA